MHSLFPPVLSFGIGRSFDFLRTHRRYRHTLLVQEASSSGSSGKTLGVGRSLPLSTFAVNIRDAGG